MATSNAQRFLTKSGDDRALALKMFWGTVLEAFRAKTLLWNSLGGAEGVGPENAPMVVASKNVSEGKSWQFPIIGQDPDPEYHTPGTELLGQQVEVDEGTVTIDDILVSHYDIPIDQISMSHFDVLGPFARKLGRSLAIDFDKKLFIIGSNAATTASVTKNGHTIHSGGNEAETVAATVAAAYADSAAGAAVFVSDLTELAEAMDNDHVPEDGRFAFATPYIRRILQNHTNLFNSDFNRSTTNDLNSRTIIELAGFQLQFTTHLPSTNITTGPPKYQGDFTVAGSGNGTPVCIALCGAEEGSAGIGYVTAGGIRPHMEVDERRNTVFMKAQMIVGADVLSPWCAGQIHVDSA